MIKIIASDMDGTLLNNDHDIDKETVEAIKRAEEAGIIFAFNTMPSAFQSGISSQKSMLDILSFESKNARCEYTRLSNKELEANLFAPWSPVQEHSPEA